MHHMKIIGKEISLADSGISGPRLMVLGGVHGNELTGIAVVRHLMRAFEEKGLALKRGSLLLALGNLRAIERHARGSVPHADMNRVFTKEKIESPGSYEEFRASELAPHMASADVMIDIHSTNKPSRPFVVARDDRPARKRLASCFPADDFLVSPPEIIGGTTDIWVTMHGGYGIGYESGLATDATKVPETVSGVLGALVELGMIDADDVPAPRAQRTVRLTEAFIMPEGEFSFATGRGEGSFEAFLEGDVLAFADGAEVRAPHDGVMMFPKLPEHRKPGSPAFFFGT